METINQVILCERIVVQYKPDNKGACYTEVYSNMYLYVNDGKAHILSKKYKDLNLSSYIINMAEVRKISYICRED